jgi:hypothetical protein
MMELESFYRKFELSCYGIIYFKNEDRAETQRDKLEDRDKWQSMGPSKNSVPNS